MQSEFLNYAEDLLNDRNVMNICNTMLDKLINANKYQSAVYLLEDIFYSTKDVKCLFQISSFYSDHLDNYYQSLYYLDKYFFFTNGNLHWRFNHLFKKNNYNDLVFEHTFEENDLDAYKLSCRYTCLLTMMVYLQPLKEYELIIKLSEYAEKLYVELEKLTSLKPLFAIDVKARQHHVSYALAFTEHHNDINRLAIRYNPDNVAPYLLIIEDLLTYGNYADALNFYNDIYCEKFTNEKKFVKEVDVIWFMADKLKAVGDFYESVMWQKMAINYECGVGS